MLLEILLGVIWLRNSPGSIFSRILTKEIRGFVQQSQNCSVYTYVCVYIYRHIKTYAEVSTSKELEGVGSSVNVCTKYFLLS